MPYGTGSAGKERVMEESTLFQRSSTGLLQNLPEYAAVLLLQPFRDISRRYNIFQKTSGPALTTVVKQPIFTL